MEKMTLTTVLTPDVLAELRACAEADGLTVSELLDEALGREVRRREVRRNALRRNRLASRLGLLQPARE
jgi:hypothetical protein